MVEILLSLEMDSLEKAESEAQKAIESTKESPKITDIVLGHLGLGLVREAQGRLEEAERNYLQCVDAFKKWEFTSFPLFHIETLSHLASIASKRGNLSKAREYSQWAKRLAEQLQSDAGLAMAWQAEASLLIASNNSKEAEEAYLRSLELWEKAGWPYYYAKALVACSEAIAQTNPEESRKRLMQAVEIFRKLGAKRNLEKAEAKLTAK
jgi:tetratricopeptide (TPR) repeat protein